MTVIDEHGTKLTGHAAIVYHSEHPELIEINPLEYVHPDKAIGDEPGPTVECTISSDLYNQLNYLGLIPTDERSHNVGESNYSKQLIQPWSIMLAYKDTHNYLELDIIKRILRSKSSDSRLLDYQKCQHILDELIRLETLKEQQ